MRIKNETHLSFWLSLLIIFTAALLRILPHPWNFSPIGAMALFGGAKFKNRIIAILFPLLALFISDLYLNNVVYKAYNPDFVWVYNGFYWQYGAFALSTVLGMILEKSFKWWKLSLFSVAGSLLFFLVSNFGVWYSGSMYLHTWYGLITCYTAGLPFLQNSLVGDIIYSFVFFGAYTIIYQQIQPKIVYSK